MGTKVQGALTLKVAGPDRVDILIFLYLKVSYVLFMYLIYFGFILLIYLFIYLFILFSFIFAMLRWLRTLHTCHRVIKYYRCRSVTVTRVTGIRLSVNKQIEP